MAVPPEAHPTIVITVGSVDPILRSSASASILCDHDGAVVVQQDVDPDSGDVHLMLYDRSGVVDDYWGEAADWCWSCTVAEATLPVVAALAAGRRYSPIVLALPVGVEPLPVVKALAKVDLPISLSNIVVVLHGDTLEHDLMGADLLADRGLALTVDDRRAVGEVLAHLIESADVVASPDELTARTQTLIRHVGGPTAPCSDMCEMPRTSLLALLDATSLDRRGNFAAVEVAGAQDADGIWTIDLRSPCPLHPTRLMTCLKTLGSGRLRGRGHFWLPSRPGELIAWDAAGGQLSIGSLGPVEGPTTHLVITGTEPVAEEIRQAFEAALVTDPETADGARLWRTDGFEAWLGTLAVAA